MNQRPALASFVIVGQTPAGQSFRPSDWAERLCGIMAPFRPGNVGRQAHLSFSPYVTPRLEGDLKCVFVDGRINQLEPMAYAFLMSFAQDNELRVKPWARSPAPA